MPVLKNLCGLSVEFVAVCRQYQELRRRDLRCEELLCWQFILCAKYLFSFFTLLSPYMQKTVLQDLVEMLPFLGEYYSYSCGI
jgi:hypothetical protein